MYKDTKKLVKNRRYAEATASYTWLWNNMTLHDQSMRGVRSSFMASDLNKLINAYADARPVFTKIRDDIEADALKVNPDQQLLRDWIVLSHRVLNDDDRVEQWAIEMDQTPDGRELLRKNYYNLRSLLIDRNHYAIYGRALPSGDSRLSRFIENYESTSKIDLEILQRHDQNKQIDDVIRIATRDGSYRHFAQSIGQSHIAYLAAGRDEEAWYVLKGGLDAVNERVVHNTILELLLKNNATRPEHLELFNLGDAYLLEKCQSQAMNHKS